MLTTNGSAINPGLFDSGDAPRNKKHAASGYKLAIQIYQRLNEVLEMVGNDPTGNPLVEYKDGLSDLKIAEEIGNGVSDKTVNTVRRQMFGQLRSKVAAAKPADEMSLRVGVLEQTMDDLLHALNMQHIPKRRI